MRDAGIPDAAASGGGSGGTGVRPMRDASSPPEFDAAISPRDSGSDGGSETPDAAIFCENSAAMTFTWEKLDPSPRPPGRYWHTLAYDEASGSMLLFGGVSDAVLADTWTWDGNEWSERVSDPSPPGRELAVMIYDTAREETVLFGGGQELPPTDLADTWRWDGTSWQELDTDHAPAARSAAMASYDAERGVTVLFGGARYGDSAPDPLPDLGDTWEWDGTDWSERAPTRQPPRRAAGVMAYDSQRKVSVLITGIQNGRTLLDDMWQWDGSKWTELMPARLPPPRRDAQMVFDSELGVLILFGGYGRTDYLDDTWIWDGTCWTEVDAGDAPPARMGARLAYDAARHESVLFGGVSGPGADLSDETWVLRGERQ